MFRLKISVADRLFSLLIRTRDGWKCQRCFTEYEPPTTSLHNSHFYGRGGKSTRFDPENCVALCWGCHQYFSCHPEEHRNFFLNRLGEKKYDRLIIRAHTPMKIDERIVAMGLRQQLTDMGVKFK